MSDKHRHEAQDELFFDQLKDQFALFYALTVSAMEAYKQLRKDYQKTTMDEGEWYLTPYLITCYPSIPDDNRNTN